MRVSNHEELEKGLAQRKLKKAKHNILLVQSLVFCLVLCITRKNAKKKFVKIFYTVLPLSTSSNTHFVNQTLVIAKALKIHQLALWICFMVLINTYCSLLHLRFTAHNPIGLIPILNLTLKNRHPEKATAYTVEQSTF